MKPIPGSLVRVITTVATNRPRVRYALVLSVSPLTPELLGNNGEPTLSIAYIDEPNLARLGRVDWHQAFERQVGVPHQTHSSVIDYNVSTYWVDVLPAAGDSISVGSIEMIDEEPLSADGPTVADPVIPAVAEQGNNQQQRKSLYFIDGVGAANTEFSGDFEVDVASTKDGSGPASLKRIDQLKVGDQLPFFAVEVTGIAPQDEDGITRIFTKSTPDVAVNDADAQGNAPANETKQYTDGSSATGPGPLPDQSPEQQAEAEKTADTEVAAT